MEHNNISIVSVDTASIQRYVFSSNKLKENIGASYIIEELLYKELMVKAIREASGETAADLLTSWQTAPEVLALATKERLAELGYIGGGNAMVLFREEAATRKFVADFSEAVLRYFPGINVVFGEATTTVAALQDADAFRAVRKRLHTSMLACRNLHRVAAHPYKPGIVDDCPASGEAAAFPVDPELPAGPWRSASTQAKLAAAGPALQHLHQQYAELLQGEFALTNEIEHLGQAPDKGYVAVVHADGNGIGKQFLGVKTLTDLRKLSCHVSDIAATVMRKVMQRVIDILHKDQERPSEQREFHLRLYEPSSSAPQELQAMARKPILPIRPILAAGDDITFVCEGRLGVHLAAEILRYFEEAEVDGHSVTACAGVAICKTHYPFFKAYHLAEELIQASKKESKKHYNTHSWLHFLAIPSGYNGSLQSVLDQQFSSSAGPLLSGPYALRDKTGNFDDLRTCLHHYLYLPVSGLSWPRNKLHELRDALREAPISQELQIAEAKARGLSFYRPLKKQLGKDEKGAPSLIFDMLQLADFYPEILFQ